MIKAGGGVEATVTRMHRRNSENSLILARKSLYIKLKGKVYNACERNVMVCGNETLAMIVENVQRIKRAGMQMVKLMYGV